MPQDQPPPPWADASSEAVIDVVAAAIVDDIVRPTRLLAARREPGQQHAGRWELPGGKVEPGETLPAALHRELLEELGITGRLHDRLIGPAPDGWWPLTTPAARVAYRMAVWVATAEAEPRAVEGHDALRWLGPEELDTVDWLEGDRPVIAALARRLWG